MDLAFTISCKTHVQWEAIEHNKSKMFSECDLKIQVILPEFLKIGKGIFEASGNLVIRS